MQYLDDDNNSSGMDFDDSDTHPGFQFWWTSVYAKFSNKFVRFIHFRLF